MQRPAIFKLSTDAEGNFTIISQLNYSKQKYQEVHRFAGHRFCPAIVLVNNRYVYVIGGFPYRSIIVKLQTVGFAATEFVLNYIHKFELVHFVYFIPASTR